MSNIEPTCLPSCVTKSRKGWVLRLWVQPRAGNDAVCGMHGEALKVRITAPPVDNKANEALVKMLSGFLGIRPGDLKIEVGQTGRRKVVVIAEDARPDWNRLKENL
ncbi:MAG: YggU family protein [Deltaproteobacteria bacterium]|nr:YggU family protein [Deltaproteobacteria bacterium]